MVQATHTSVAVGTVALQRQAQYLYSQPTTCVHLSHLLPEMPVMGLPVKTSTSTSGQCGHTLQINGSRQDKVK